MGTGFPYYTSRSYWIVSGLPSPWHILFNFSCHLFDSRLKKIGWLNYIEKRAVSFSLWQLSRPQLLGREPRNSRKHELAAGKRYVVLCTYQIPYHFLCCIWKKNWPLLLLQSHPHRHPFVLIPFTLPHCVLYRPTFRWMEIWNGFSVVSRGIKQNTSFCINHSAVYIFIIDPIQTDRKMLNWCQEIIQIIY